MFRSGQIAVLGLSLSFVLGAGEVRADLRTEMAAAGEKIDPITSRADVEVLEGKVLEVNRQLLAVFPQKSRTPVEALVLANVLFRFDPQDSYALHKQAIEGLPNETSAQLEWALEQHRAAEFEAAGQTYAKLIKHDPNNGPLHGMYAECLLRTGHTSQAAEEWAASERGSGSLDTLEEWVCEVHTHDIPELIRADFYNKAKAGDAEAAASLVAIDCDFPRDWWNREPRPLYLKKDIELLKSIKFTKAGERISAAICAAQCGIILAEEKGDGAATLRDAQYLLDAKHTLPENGHLLSTMENAAESSGAIQAKQAREKYGQAILNQARQTNDAETFNVAAHLYLGTDQLRGIDLQAWTATGDARFAISYLVGLAEQGKLKADSPELLKAVKQFPDDSMIAGLYLAKLRESGKPTDAALIAAIEAEYSHFSANPGGLETRPSARPLRVYFAELLKSVKANAR